MEEKIRTENKCVCGQPIPRKPEHYFYNLLRYTRCFTRTNEHDQVKLSSFIESKVWVNLLQFHQLTFGVVQKSKRNPFHEHNVLCTVNKTSQVYVTEKIRMNWIDCEVTSFCRSHRKSVYSSHSVIDWKITTIIRTILKQTLNATKIWIDASLHTLRIDVNENIVVFYQPYAVFQSVEILNKPYPNAWAYCTRLIGFYWPCKMACMAKTKCKSNTGARAIKNYDVLWVAVVSMNNKRQETTSRYECHRRHAHVREWTAYCGRFLFECVWAMSCFACADLDIRTY